jgi:hypothetical protein
MDSNADQATLTSNLRQGDIIRAHLGGIGKTVGITEDPCCVAILSQTCDVTQPSKQYCLVAPAAQIEDHLHRAALKGRKPLLVPLDDESGGRWTADLGRAF